MTKKKAIESCSEVMINTNYKATKGVLFDLMRRSVDDGERHCSSCNCQSYVTFTGWTIKPKDEAMMKKLWDMNTEQRLTFARANLELVIQDA